MRLPVLFLLLAGCPESIGVGERDAGDAGRADAARDAGADTGTDAGADAGADGGADAGADGGGDAGFVDAGPEDSGVPPAPLTFGQMQVPNDQVSTVTIWGRSPSEIYAGTVNGNVLRFDTDQGWHFVWHEPTNFGIRRIRGTASKIFVASSAKLWVHDAELGDAPREYGVGSQVNDLFVVSDTEAYLVADITNGRAVFAFDGNGVTVLRDDLNVAVLYGIYVDDDGTLLVSGNGKIFRRAQFVWTEDPIDWPPSWGVADIANFDLYDVTRVGDTLYAVGDDHHVLAWDGAIWRFVYEPMRGESLRAMAALSSGEAYAVGRVVTGGPIVRFAGGAFTHTMWPENHNLYDIWVASPDEIYVAGTLGSTLDPIILRGSR